MNYQVLNDIIDLMTAAHNRADECQLCLDMEHPDQFAWESAREHALRVIDIIDDVLSTLDTVVATYRTADAEAQDCFAALRMRIDDEEAE